jgi:hypothetical protein
MRRLIPISLQSIKGHKRDSQRVLDQYEDTRMEGTKGVQYPLQVSKIRFFSAAITTTMAILLGVFGNALAKAAVDPGWSIHIVASPTVFAAQGAGVEGEKFNRYHVYVTNVSGHEAQPGTVIKLNLGNELELAGVPIEAEDLLSGVSTVNSGSWECEESPEPECSYEDSVPAYDTLVMTVHVAASKVRQTSVNSKASVEGGGSGFSEVNTAVSTEVGSPPPSFGLQGDYIETLNGEGGFDSLAGDHPSSLNVGFTVNTLFESGNIEVTGDLKRVAFALPPGLIGDPQALAKCPETDLTKQPSETEEEEGKIEVSRCPIASRIGAVVIEPVALSGIERSGGPTKEISYVYNMVPEKGFAAEFGFDYLQRGIAMYGSLVKSGKGYEVEVSGSVPDVFQIAGAYFTMFGDPAVANGEAGSNNQSSAFLRNPTTCSPDGVSGGIEVETWQQGHAAGSTSAYPSGLSNCEGLQFHPELEATPFGSLAKFVDSPIGISIATKVQQAPNMIDIRATPDLRTAVVTLPSGIAISPSAGAGLEGCTAAQFYTEGESQVTQPAACPETSQIGEVELRTPLLEDAVQPLKGQVYLAQPECDPCSSEDAQDGRLLHLYVQIEGPGFYVKLTGEGQIEPSTGQLTTTFRESPQLPFSELKLKLHGGSRAPLANPQTCGVLPVTSAIEPWSSPQTPGASPSSVFDVDEGCATPMPFMPSFTAGTTTPIAGSYSPFTLTLSRQDGEQDLSKLSTTLPPGLLAAISHVMLCREPQAIEGSCPEASRIGSVHVAAGSGSQPLWETGSAYLTASYEGAPFGLSVVVPAVAGPFNLGTVVVQAGIEIDPHTAVVTVVSDAFPQMLDGIPLRIKTVNITLEHSQFTFNPTNCTPKTVTGVVGSVQGGSVNVSSSFDVGGCQNLPFVPKLSASTVSKATKVNGTSLKVVITYPGSGEANAAKVMIEFPKQLPVRLTTLHQACRATVFEANPASCPEGSLIGTGTVHTPILNQPLTGPAYLVSHGGAAFPDVVFVLQGEGVTLEVDGQSFVSSAGVLKVMFNSIPDAPFSTFETTLPSGPHSQFTSSKTASRASASQCGESLIAPTIIIGQNGAQITQQTKIAIEGCRQSKPKVSIGKVKIKSNSVSVSVTTSRSGRLTISGAGLKSKMVKDLAAGTHRVTVALTKTGRMVRAHDGALKIDAVLAVKKTVTQVHKKIKL